MEAITHFTQSSLKANAPELRTGDTVRVHQRIREGNKERIQIFEGIVISVRGGRSINSSYVVRRIASNGIGVEKTFPLHSPNVVKVERLKSSKVRQARLFYMRERFGRLARMRGEVKNAGDWTEAEAQAAEVTDEPTVNEANEEVEELAVENQPEEVSQETEADPDAEVGELVESQDEPASEKNEETAGPQDENVNTASTEFSTESE